VSAHVVNNLVFKYVSSGDKRNHKQSIRVEGAFQIS
jgi:hypothetical protein